MEKSNSEETMNIREFFRGKKILVTGFTGVVGKLLVEKLVYSCPEIEKIYVLVRAKKGIDPEERIKNVFSSKAYIRFQENPALKSNLESTVKGIYGDVCEDRLGLSPEDEELLRNEVNIIFHGAATVRFDDTLSTAYTVNAAGTKRIVDLALNMPHLLCLTYISTAFSNCEMSRIKEEIYPAPADWRKTQAVCDKIDPATLQILHMKYIDKAPNTYTFTKALAENIINDYRDKLPVIIVRPSVVTLSYQEPVPYFMDNIYGPTAFVIAAFIGLMNVTLADPENRLNQIPSDMAVNSTIATTWKRALQSEQEKKPEIDVYNICCPNEIILTTYELVKGFNRDMKMKKMFTNDGIWKDMHYDIHPNKRSWKINCFIRHLVSAYIIDAILAVKGIKPVVVRLRRRLFLAMMQVAYFSSNNFYFEINNMEKLYHDLKPEDRESFRMSFDINKITSNWCEVMTSFKSTILAPLYEDIKTNSKRIAMLRAMDKFGTALSFFVISLLLYYLVLPTRLLASAINALS